MSEATAGLSMAADFLRRYGYSPADFSYQEVRFPDGSRLGRHSRSATADAIFPASLTDLTVLDYGCNIGALCLEAARRNARRVLGVDVSRTALALARDLAHYLGLPCEFQTPHILHSSPRQIFDYVLCLNVLHHVSDPLSVLDLLADSTRRLLAIELAGPSLRDSLKLGFSSLVPFVLLNRHPLLIVPSPFTDKKTKSFYMTETFIRNYLLRTRLRFSPHVRSIPTFKGRRLLLFRTVSLDRILIVAGPTGIGKRTFADEISRRKTSISPDLLEESGIGTKLLSRQDFLRCSHRQREATLRVDVLSEYERYGSFSAASHLRDLAVVAKDRICILLFEPREEIVRRIQTFQTLGNTKMAEKLSRYLAAESVLLEAAASWIRFARTDLDCRRIVVVSRSRGEQWDVRNVSGDPTELLGKIWGSSTNVI